MLSYQKKKMQLFFTGGVEIPDGIGVVGVFLIPLVLQACLSPIYRRSQRPSTDFNHDHISKLRVTFA